MVNHLLCQAATPVLSGVLSEQPSQKYEEQIDFGLTMEYDYIICLFSHDLWDLLRKRDFSMILFIMLCLRYFLVYSLFTL